MAANQITRIRSFEDAEGTDLVHSLEVLRGAADGFVKPIDGTVQIWAASRDWFQEEWGRDTFISLPGLLLSTGRFDDAKKVFTHFAAFEKDGLIPNVVREHIEYNTADASLWFIHALRRYGEISGDDAFVDEMADVVRSIILGYLHGTGYERGGHYYRVYVDDADGLVVSPPQATWMDADPSGTGEHAVTPRDGKCVEINALWYGALLFTKKVLVRRGEDTVWLDTAAAKVQRSFAKFWNEEARCLYDVIEGDPHGGAVRPNQLFAITHGADLMNTAQRRMVLERVESDLLTPAGLRTLSPEDSYYRGQYDTYAPMAEKDLAYHQGTIWPWLMGVYCDAYALVHQEEDSKPAVARLIKPLARFCIESEFVSLPEVFSGDEPYEPGGTTSQAWSIAEVLRIVDLLNRVR